MSKVLLVEDEERLIGFLTPLLQKRGFEVSAVSSGEEAIKKYPEYKPDIILLDLGLSGEITGYEVLADIKSNSPEIKVAIITGYSESYAKEKTDSLGADLFFKKPFIPSKLFTALQEILDLDKQKE